MRCRSTRSPPLFLEHLSAVTLDPRKPGIAAAEVGNLRLSATRLETAQLSDGNSSPLDHDDLSGLCGIDDSPGLFVKLANGHTPHVSNVTRGLVGFNRGA